MKYILILISCLLFAIPSQLKAENTNDKELLSLDAFEEDSFGHDFYHFPELKPEFTFGSGLRFSDKGGSNRGLEFHHFEDSVWTHGESRIFEYPHRQYLNFDYVTAKDHFADLRYAYGENQFFFRWINTSLFHNLGAIRYTYPFPVGYAAEVRDSSVEYGLQNEKNYVFLRLKAHDFPFHLYFNGHLVSRKGTMQQRSPLGGAIFNNIIFTSQLRDVDWTTETYTFGTNSHLGPIEVEYVHKEKRFDTDKDRVLYDSYGNSILGPTTYRLAGTYPHNLIPKLKGSINTIKVHSSYTGQWVATAAFSQNSRENESSGAKSEALTGSGTLHWKPRPDFSLNLKYSHRDLDVENPAQITMTDVSDTTNFVTYNPKASVSSAKSNISLYSKYKPLKRITLRAKYLFSEITRNNADIWHLQESTKHNRFTFTTDSELDKNLTARLKYQYKHVQAPSYNIEPDSSHEGNATITWIPHPRVNLIFAYKVSQQKRDELQFNDSSSPTNVRPNNREVKLDDFMTTGAFQIRDNLSMSLSYLYVRYKVTQDIYTHSSVPNPPGNWPPQVDYGVQYEDRAHVYSIGLQFQPLENFHTTAEITHTRNSGEFTPGTDFHLLPVSIASFSDQEVVETYCRLTGQYTFSNDLTLGIEYTYADFDDLLDNIYDSEEDGWGNILMLNVSKAW